jgi:hypothetical protein
MPPTPTGPPNRWVPNPKYHRRRLMSNCTGDQADRRNPFAMAQAGWADALASVSRAAIGAGQAHLDLAAAASAAVAAHSEGERATAAILEALRNAEAASRERLQHMPAGAGVPVSCTQLRQALARVKWVCSLETIARKFYVRAAKLVGLRDRKVIEDAEQALSADPPPRFITGVLNALLQASRALCSHETAVDRTVHRLRSVSSTRRLLSGELRSASHIFARLVVAAEQVSRSRGAAPSIPLTDGISLTDGINVLVSLQRAIAAVRAAYQEYEIAEQQAFHAATALSLPFADAAAGCVEEGGDD